MAEHPVHAPFAKAASLRARGAGALALHHRQRRGRRLLGGPGGERRLLAHLPEGQHLRRNGADDRRAARPTVVASSDCECYRLDKTGFEEIIRARPELAESMSHTLALRLQQIDEMKDEYRRETSDSEKKRPTVPHSVQRIRDFFGLK